MERIKLIFMDVEQRVVGHACSVTPLLGHATSVTYMTGFVIRRPSSVSRNGHSSFFSFVI